ncbi:Smr/MutS family protein [Euzebyella saccharophila]|uniref:Smr/MutS family protein n=1 Tax=Euzebyella saccharophila TaxID=679664 RepID=A0ABV8JWN6_9FLAO|nr:Smr/MutS family protein [Euzebyella saccharophila]
MTVFKVGDSVEVLDDLISGRVIKVRPTEITIETDEGFFLDFEPAELVIVESGEIRVSNFEVSQMKSQKEQPKRKRSASVKPKKRNAPKMEVDLHINQLTKNTKGLSNFDMLNIQMDAARRQLEFAIGKRIQKVIFIHGVGEGVLREELYSLFRRYDNLKYYDADYSQYGLGATEVYIFQNG